MLPVLAVVYYHHSLLEKYRAQVSNDAYLMQKAALEKAAELAPAPAVATAEPAPADVAPVPLRSQSWPRRRRRRARNPRSSAPAGSASESCRRSSQPGPRQTLVTASGAAGQGGECGRSFRVRLIPSTRRRRPQESGGDLDRPTERIAGPTIPDDSPNTKVAKAEEPSRAGDASGPRDGRRRPSQARCGPLAGWTRPRESPG